MANSGSVLFEHFTTLSNISISIFASQSVFPEGVLMTLTQLYIFLKSGQLLLHYLLSTINIVITITGVMPIDETVGKKRSRAFGVFIQ